MAAAGWTRHAEVRARVSSVRPANKCRLELGQSLGDAQACAVQHVVASELDRKVRCRELLRVGELLALHLVRIHCFTVLSVHRV